MTIYAIGTALTAVPLTAVPLTAVPLTAVPLTAVPLTAATAGWRRRRLLLTTVAGFAAADAAQAMLVTLWNVALAGGVAGGVLLHLFGTTSLAWSTLALLAPVLAAVLAARTHGFPAHR